MGRMRNGPSVTVTSRCSEEARPTATHVARLPYCAIRFPWSSIGRFLPVGKHSFGGGSTDRHVGTLHLKRGNSPIQTEESGCYETIAH